MKRPLDPHINFMLQLFGIKKLCLKLNKNKSNDEKYKLFVTADMDNSHFPHCIEYLRHESHLENFYKMWAVNFSKRIYNMIPQADLQTALVECKNNKQLIQWLLLYYPNTISTRSDVQYINSAYDLATYLKRHA